MSKGIPINNLKKKLKKFSFTYLEIDLKFFIFFSFSQRNYKNRRPTPSTKTHVAQSIEELERCSISQKIASVTSYLFI